MSRNPYNPDDLLPIGEAARIAGVSVGTLRVWEDTGRIAAQRTPGGQRRFRRGDVEALVTRPVEAAS